MLITRGATVDKKVLFIATQCPHVDCAVTIINRCGNSEVNIQDDSGNTALHIAALSYNVSVEVVKALLDRGAHCNAQNRQGMTPLHLAASACCEEKVKLLLARGASIKQLNKNNKTPSDLANNERVKILFRDAESNLSASLFDALQSRRLDSARDALNRGAKVNARNNYGQSPLHVTAESGYIEGARLLFEHHADLRAEDHFKSTPLHYAADNCHGFMVKELIERRVRELSVRIFSNTKNAGRITPLHGATANDAEIHRFLNAKNADQITPLHSALAKGHPETVRLLIEMGAQAILGLFLWRLNADVQELPEIIRDLASRTDLHVSDALGNNPLHVAVQSANLAVVSAILNMRPEMVDSVNQGGMMPLHLAALCGNVGIVRALLERMPFWTVDVGRATVDVTNREGMTPLHLAASRGNVEIVRALLNRGANREFRDANGELALYKAVNARPQVAEIIKLLGGVKCAICLELVSWHVRALTRLECGHEFCYDCLLGLVDSAISDQSAHTLKCPESNCRRQLSENDMQQIIRYNPERKAELSRSCPRCLQLRHSGTTCHEQAEIERRARSARKPEDALSETYVEKHRCPNPDCRLPIERSVGCNHMTCTPCGWQFCYICKAKWPCNSH